MFVFSEIHNAQNEEAVKQILVFTDSIQEQLFETRYKAAVEKQGISSAHYAGLGAMLMIRSVLNGEDQWEPCIRCGESGRAIWSGKPEASFIDGLKQAMQQIGQSYP